MFLFTGNSARSRMAEDLLRHLAGDDLKVSSAGTHSSPVRPEAVTVMRELGMDISGHRSKPEEEFHGQPCHYVITVCDGARQSCLVFPGPARRIHWSLEDPAAATGDGIERLAVFRRVRDEPAGRIREFLAERQS